MSIHSFTISLYVNLSSPFDEFKFSIICTFFLKELYIIESIYFPLDILPMITRIGDEA